MEIYRYQKGEPQEYSSLWNALDLNETDHRVVSFAGAGGKTSLMFAMASEAAAKGLRVIVTTSTKIYRPDHCQGVLAQTARELKGAVKNGSVVVAGQYFSQEKLKGLPEAEIGSLIDYADILLIEADGARRLPLKFPGDHEPVLIPETKAVIGCAGLDSMGQRFCDACFRYELAAPVLSLSEETKISPQVLGAVLSRMDCARKGTEGMEYRAVLNKMDLVGKALAFCAAAEVEKALNRFSVVTSLNRKP